MTQTDVILDMLYRKELVAFRAEADRPELLTAYEALEDAGCLRLAARIKDLRDEGHNIVTEMVQGKHGKRYAGYYLVLTREQRAEKCNPGVSPDFTKHLDFLF